MRVFSIRSHPNSLPRPRTEIEFHSVLLLILGKRKEKSGGAGSKCVAMERYLSRFPFHSESDGDDFHSYTTAQHVS